MFPFMCNSLRHKKGGWVCVAIATLLAAVCVQTTLAFSWQKATLTPEVFKVDLPYWLSSSAYSCSPFYTCIWNGGVNVTKCGVIQLLGLMRNPYLSCVSGVIRTVQFKRNSSNVLALFGEGMNWTITSCDESEPWFLTNLDKPARFSFYSSHKDRRLQIIDDDSKSVHAIIAQEGSNPSNWFLHHYHQLLVGGPADEQVSPYSLYFDTDIIPFEIILVLTIMDAEKKWTEFSCPPKPLPKSKSLRVQGTQSTTAGNLDYVSTRDKNVLSHELLRLKNETSDANAVIVSKSMLQKNPDTAEAVRPVPPTTQKPISASFMKSPSRRLIFDQLAKSPPDPLSAIPPAILPVGNVPNSRNRFIRRQSFPAIPPISGENEETENDRPLSSRGPRCNCFLRCGSI